MLDPGTYEIIAHAYIFDDGAAQTSGTEGFPSDGPQLVLDCSGTTAVTVTSLTARAGSSSLPLTLAASGLLILVGVAVVLRRRH